MGLPNEFVETVQMNVPKFGGVVTVNTTDVEHFRAQGGTVVGESPAPAAVAAVAAAADVAAPDAPSAPAASAAPATAPADAPADAKPAKK